MYIQYLLYTRQLYVDSHTRPPKPSHKSLSQLPPLIYTQALSYVRVCVGVCVLQSQFVDIFYHFLYVMLAIKYENQ